METLDVSGIAIDLHRAGSGPPLLYLHAELFFEQTKPHLDALASTWTVVAPRHPGFGKAAAPADFRTVGDIAYLYQDLLEKLDLTNVVVVGASLGGWIALEMAVRNTSRIAKLVLAGAVGVKFSDREERDFADLFYLPESELQETLFADPKRWAPNYAALPLEQVETIARERQTTAYYGWKPYLHNPGLKRWLHRVDVPTLVLSGEQDRFAAPGYARKLAESMPKAQLKLIAGAGHYPGIEQSDAVVRAIAAF